MPDARKAERLPDTLPADPLPLASDWLAEAGAAGVRRNANSMSLVTVTPDGAPTARIVLCKELVVDPGYLVFYTNYQSRKAREIEANARVGALFHWDTLGRQIRVEGLAVRSPEAESDAYFATRDRGSQLGAWGSDQSEPIDSYAALETQVRERSLRFADTVPRPPHWGGYRLWPTLVELWVDGPDRLHDRAVWTRTLTPDRASDFIASAWSAGRLQP